MRTEQIHELVLNHPDNVIEQYRKTQLKDFRLGSYRLEGNCISEPLEESAVMNEKQPPGSGVKLLLPPRALQQTQIVSMLNEE